MSTSRTKSGYEKAVLLELRLGRIVAWLTFLLMAAFVVAIILDVIHPGLAGGFGIMAILLITAVLSARCEVRAEGQLKEIWSTEQLADLAGGS